MVLFCFIQAAAFNRLSVCFLQVVLEVIIPFVYIFFSLLIKLGGDIFEK